MPPVADFARLPLAVNDRMAVLEAAMLANLTMWLATREQWPSAVAALLPFCGGLAQLLTPLRSDDDASAAL